MGFAQSMALFNDIRSESSTSKSQDSHAHLAGQEGFEPTTHGFGIRCSTNWSYWPILRSYLFNDFRDNTCTYRAATFSNRKP